MTRFLVIDTFIESQKKLVASAAEFTGKNCRLNISKLERQILVIFGMWSHLNAYLNMIISEAHLKGLNWVVLLEDQ